MLSEFMKRRIRQLVVEYKDPLVVLQQLMTNAEMTNDPQQAEEAAEYIIICSSEVPGVDFSGIQKLGEQLGFAVEKMNNRKKAARMKKAEIEADEEIDDEDDDGELFGDLEDLDYSQIEDLLDYTDDMQEIYEKAAEKAAKDYPKIKGKPVKLTHFFKAISNTVVVKDLLSLLRIINSQGTAKLEVNRFGQLEESAFNELSKCIADSPAKDFIITDRNGKISYLDILLTVIIKSDLVNLSKKGISLTASGKNALEGKEIEDAFFRMVLEFLFFPPLVSLEHEEVEDVEITPDGMPHNFIYALSRISQEWTTTEESFLPLLACIDDFVRFDLLVTYDSDSYPDDLEAMRFLIDGFSATFGKMLEFFGLLEFKSRRNFPDKVCLTALGHEVFNGIIKQLNKFSLICSKIDYLSSIIDGFYFQTEMFPDMKKFRTTADFKKIIDIKDQVSACYDDLIEMTTDGIPGKSKLDKFDSEINTLNKDMGEVIEHIKRLIKYETNIEKVQNRKKLK
ncbi:MAG: hypothetical protein LWY06_05700 [Firmicutes bacterium]|nr:hypothetical protein [Bacillota bacterium]